jgi:hypothetical protein
MQTYRVTVLFNSRLQGANQSWTGKIEAESMSHAIDRAIGYATRDPRHGQSLYVYACMAYLVDEHG